MELNYTLTCNPWSDRGAIILAELLEPEIGIVKDVIVEPGKIVIRFLDEASNEEIAKTLSGILRERQNKVFVPNSLARALTALNRDVALTDANGNRSPEVMVLVREEDIPELKKRGITTIKAGNNRIYRLAASYPGMPGDVRGLMDKAELLSEQVTQETTDSTPKRVGTCAMSDNLTPHLESLTQSLHIFANKHHNAAVRGFSGGNGYFRAGAAWRYALALSATEPYHPFFETRDKGTTLLMSVADDFCLLRRLQRHFKNFALRDITGFNTPTSSTNIRDLYQSDLYSSLISLFHCLRNKLTESIPSEDMLDPTEIPQLTRWITGQFKRATYVSFGTFHTIEADPRAFQYVQPLAVEWHEARFSYQPVRDVFKRITWPETGIAGRFSFALIKSSGSAMKAALWEVYKDHNNIAFQRSQQGEPTVLYLFNDFINHFVKEAYRNMDQSNHPEVLTAAKKMGTLVGSAFDDDLTLLSRVYNVHTVEELRDVLKTVLFRLEKLAVAQARTPNKSTNKRIWSLNNELFEVLLENINETTYREIADILSIFASLNAFNNTVRGKKNDAAVVGGSASTDSDEVNQGEMS